MTSAHRPTFDPARGKEALRGAGYHQRLLPAYTKLKFRQPGQGNDEETQTRDLRAELLAAEAAHRAKLHGGAAASSAAGGGGAGEGDETKRLELPAKRPLALASAADGKLGDDGGGGGDDDGDDDEDPAAKRRRVLEESRDIDADESEEDEDGDDDDDDSESDSEDEEVELQRELERVRRERAEKRAKEEQERAAADEEAREREIARGNPLLNKPDFTVKRRWDDDVVFKNQARGTEEKGKKKEFINDLLRSDFHRRFMSKYVR